MPEEGTLYVGDEGRLFVSWEGLRVWPEEKAAEFEKVPRELPRRGEIYVEWQEACRGKETAGCDFEWGGLLTESVLLGNMAIRSGRLLEWDPVNLRVTNHEAANQFIREKARKGWEL